MLGWSRQKLLNLSGASSATDRVCDVLMPRIMLQHPGVVPVLGQLEPAGVPEHMGMGREGQPCRLASPGHELADVARGHRAATFGHEQIGRVGPVPAKLSQRGPRSAWVEGTPFLSRVTCSRPALRSTRYRADCGTETTVRTTPCVHHLCITPAQSGDRSNSVTY